MEDAMQHMDQGELEKRGGGDRRGVPTPMLSRFTFIGGRRSGGRREGESVNIFVDRFGQTLFFMATMVILLNVLDAFFTLLFLGNGGRELNPVAQFFLDQGPVAFLLVKTAGIGLCVAYLVLVNRFKGAKIGMGVVFVIYLALLCWHIYLYGRLM
jgi:hypothetical protein